MENSIAKLIEEFTNKVELSDQIKLISAFILSQIYESYERQRIEKNFVMWMRHSIKNHSIAWFDEDIIEVLKRGVE